MRGQSSWKKGERGPRNEHELTPMTMSAVTANRWTAPEPPLEFRALEIGHSDLELGEIRVYSRSFAVLRLLWRLRETCQDCLLHMQPILRLVEDDGARVVQDRLHHLLSGVGRQAV